MTAPIVKDRLLYPVDHFVLRSCGLRIVHFVVDYIPHTIGIPPDEGNPRTTAPMMYSSIAHSSIPSDRPPPRLSLFISLSRPSTLQPIAARAFVERGSTRARIELWLRETPWWRTARTSRSPDRSLLHALSEVEPISVVPRMLIVEDLRLMLGTIRIVVEEEDARKSVHRTKAGYDVVDAEDGGKRIQQLRSCENPAMVDAIL